MSAESVAWLNREEIETLRANADDYESREALFKKQMATVEEQNQILRAMPAANEREYNEDRAKLDALAKEKESIKSEIAELQKYLEDCEGEQKVGYQGMVEKAAELYASLEQSKIAFEAVEDLIKAAPDASTATKNLQNANIGFATEAELAWPQRILTLDRSLRNFEHWDKNFAEQGADVKVSDDLKKLATDVRTLHERITGPLAREASRRKNYDDNLDELRDSQKKIITWCRQQRAMLEALKDPEHIQEFINSFQSNISVMETNFLVLMELAEPLMPNDEVAKLMMETTEVWLGLEVYAFEKMHATILSQHAESGMEDNAKTWVKSSPKIKEFLEAALRLLEMPTDEESKSVTEPVLKMCKGIMEDFDAHSIIVEHLSDFSLREQLLKDYYNAIRSTVFSKLTISTQVYNGQYNFERKQQYMDRLAELTDWVQSKSQTGAWKQLLERVDNMKLMIEENEVLHGNVEERN